MKSPYAPDKQSMKILCDHLAVAVRLLTKVDCSMLFSSLTCRMELFQSLIDIYIIYFCHASFLFFVAQLCGILSF